ncbi:MAG TPA: response regulator transcription factor [Rubricoccaceae bacterium]|nr:response regulator transcription factor [Rubricoccaceae bacterium]
MPEPTFMVSLAFHAPPSPVPLPLHVVVADDSALVRRHLVEQLGRLDHVEVVGEAADTPSAVRAAEAHHPEVVVLDIQMPGENGIVALQRIKRLLPATRVIMLTNHADPFYRRKCLSAGASHFFDKSTEFHEVVEVVRRLARASGAAGGGVRA